MKNFGILLISIALCFLTAAIAGFAMSDSIATWYPTLVKPTWNPPNWVFAPVWTVLYTLMGISLYLIGISRAKQRRKAILLFIIQLAFNALWSILFFAFQSPNMAFIEILFLWLFLFLCIKLFWRINIFASILLLPYLAWITFSIYLNYTITTLN